MIRTRSRGGRRVPVVLQMTLNDCGAACLTAVLRAHGHHTTLAECRLRTGGGRDGVTARAIAHAARSYGLSTTAYRADPATLDQVPLPAVAHWEDVHFVVLEHVGHRRIEIMDPALGRRTLTDEEVARDLGRAVVSLRPGPAFALRPPTREHRPRLPAGVRQAIAGCRSLIAAALVASLALSLLMLGVPILTALLVDDVMVARDAGLLPALGVAALVAAAAFLAISQARTAALVALQRRIDGSITRSILRHLLALPLSFFQQRAGGDLLSRLLASSAVIRELVTTQLLGVVLDGGFMIVYLVLLLVAAPDLGAIVAAFGVAQALVLLASRGRARRLRQRHLLAQSKAHSVLFQMLTGIATVKATGSEGRVFDAWSRRFEIENALDARQNGVEASVQNATTVLRTLAPLALLWFGAPSVLDGTLALGSLIALQTLALAFLQPLSSVITNAQHLQVVGAHIERLRDVLDAAPEPTESSPGVARSLSGHIELRSVSFAYDSWTAPVLREVSLVIEPGQKVAVVGPSGSGKSTLGLLLLGLLTPNSGEILYDGVPLADLGRPKVRSGFGVVLQEPFVFGETVRSNIAGNQPQMSASKSNGLRDSLRSTTMSRRCP